MTLFSRADDPWSHRTRIVLAEKSIHVETIDVQDGNLPEDLLDLNPYHTVPTLVDRDLVLYDSRVIIEYLDERFPHPPLMPVDPVARAQFRLALYRIERDWYTLAQQIDDPADRKLGQKARKILRDSILASTDVFKAKPYFLSDEFSLVDATIAPILWRLQRWEIDMPPQAQADRQVRAACCSRGRRFATACRASSRRCAPDEMKQMADAPVRSRRPYLLRAMHEWISDCNQTPHIVVDASIAGVEVPRQYVQGGKIILNVSNSATSGLSLGNDFVRFRARFGAATYDVSVPDRRGARRLRARDGAGNDLLGSRRAAAAADAAGTADERSEAKRPSHAEGGQVQPERRTNDRGRQSRTTAPASYRAHALRAPSRIQARAAPLRALNESSLATLKSLRPHGAVVDAIGALGP